MPLPLQRIGQKLATMAVLMSLAALPQSSWGQDVSDLDRFQLWNGCEAVRLLVEVLNDDAAAISLTREAIGTAVRSRLRGARIFSEKWLSDDGSISRPYLYVNVNVVGPAYNVYMALQKAVDDPLSGVSSFAKTWFNGSTGTHGRDSGYILSNIAELTDIFIDNYLRVNAEACG